MAQSKKSPKSKPSTKKPASPAGKAAAAVAAMMPYKRKPSPPADSPPPPTGNAKPPEEKKPENRQPSGNRRFFRDIAPAVIILLLLLIVVLLAGYGALRLISPLILQDSDRESTPVKSTVSAMVGGKQVICDKDSTVKIEKGAMVFEHCRALGDYGDTSKRLSCLDSPMTRDADGNYIYTNCRLLPEENPEPEKLVVCGKDSTFSVESDMIVFRHCQRSPALIAELEKNQSMNRELSCLDADIEQLPDGGFVYKGCKRK